MPNHRTVEELLALLHVPEAYPEAVIAEILSRSEECSPALLALFQNPTQVYTSRIDSSEDLPFFAMYILASLREQRFFPELIRLLQHPGDFADFWGDILSEDAPRLLLSVYNGDLNSLQALIRASTLDPEIRSVGLRTMGMLYAHGRLTREILIQEMTELKDQKASHESLENTLYAELLYLIVELQISELQDYARTLMNGPLKSSLHEAEFQDAFSLDAALVLKKYLDEKQHQPIVNLPTEINRWFEPNLPKYVAQAKPATGKTTSIDRNEPCPCGSGRKYRKCCGTY